MLGLRSIAAKLFGTTNDRKVTKYKPRVAEINALEAEMSGLTDEQLQARTAMFREQLAAGKTLDDILVPAFATVREASRRALGMRHFDVQMIGGMVLHEGQIAEMKTGEGKTLAATMPLYLNALAGKGAHLVTVNDYLARRDAEWMGPIYHFLGLTVGVIVHGMDDDERRKAYHTDITYGTNNEFGFDYLRDNMKFSLDDYVQRDFFYAIVDEVDSILIDEARTPLIISGPSDESTDKYARVNQVTPALFKKYPDARQFAQADPAELEEAIRSTGFFRQKTKSIVTASKMILERFGGKVRFMRDPTRGGLAAVLNEIADDRKWGIAIDEAEPEALMSYRRTSMPDTRTRSPWYTQEDEWPRYYLIHRAHFGMEGAPVAFSAMPGVVVSIGGVTNVTDAGGNYRIVGARPGRIP